MTRTDCPWWSRSSLLFPCALVALLLLCISAACQPATPTGPWAVDTCLTNADCPEESHCSLGSCVSGVALEVPSEGKAEGSPDEAEPTRETPDASDASFDSPTDNTSDANPDSTPDTCRATNEICNGLDDDCDGTIDNNLKDLDLPCSVEGKTGICATGKRTGCQNGKIVCEATKPTTEKCNNLDDDCDGSVDEDFSENGSTCKIPNRQGECGKGVISQCVGGSLVCVPNTPVIEICDGLDNDCDGGVDEEFPNQGSTCTLPNLKGPCVFGSIACTNQKETCEQIVMPTNEVCDGVDNNCDGKIDEGCSCAGKEVRDCFSGNVALRGVGVCKVGKQTCKNGVWGSCVGEVPPSKETCDGLDNDCNGKNDDFQYASNDTCNVPKLGSGQRCLKGTKECKNGRENCIVSTPITKTLISGRGFSEGKLAPCSQSRIGNPFALIASANGVLYVSSATTHAIYTINASGDVALLAGAADGTSGKTDNMDPKKALFNAPSGLAFDDKGNLYVADRGNHLIRKIVFDNQGKPGEVSTFAGSGRALFANGKGAAASFKQPYDVAWSTKHKRLYVADSENHRIRAIDEQGNVTTLAGNGQGDFKDDVGTRAKFKSPRGLLFDSSSGFLYVADTLNHCIRKVNPGNTRVSTLAGDCEKSGRDNNNLGNSKFANPMRLALGGSNEIYVSDEANQIIRRIDLGAKQVSTFAGKVNTAGFLNSITKESMFQRPIGIVFVQNIGLLVADQQNQMIRRVEGGRVRSYAGEKDQSQFKAGHRLCAKIDRPSMAVLDPNAANVMYVADKARHVIFRIDFSLDRAEVFAGDGVEGEEDGLRFSARFKQPEGLAIDALGNLYIADTGNHLIRRIDTTGQVSTVAGSDEGFVNDAIGTQSKFRFPAGLAVNAAGELLVADRGNHCIRLIKVTPKGETSTYAGKCEARGNIDGDKATSRLNQPHGLVIDSAGLLYVSELGVHKIRTIKTSGGVTTYAGNGGGRKDGSPTAARFNGPQGLALSPILGLIIADTNNNVIRRIDATPEVFTLSGTSNAGFTDDIDANAQFSKPSDVILDGKGNIYVLDQANSALRLLPACP